MGVFLLGKTERFLTLRVQPYLKTKSITTRFFEYSVLPLSLFVGGLIVGRKKNIIHCQSPPLTVAFAACVLSKILKKPLIIRIQDIHPDALIKIGILKNSVLIRLMELVELFVYDSASHITVIAEGYRRHLISKGIREDKISLIPNWANISKISPPKNNDFKKRMGWEAKFIITYAGTMSWPQDLETVVESAGTLRNYKDITFLMVGDGVKKEYLIRKSKELELDNIVFMPLQPRNDYFEILYASNACLVPLKKQFTSPTAPSKMLEIMACSKPIIANVPYNSDVHTIISKAGCGIWVEPENPKVLSRAILKLYENKDSAYRLGEKGRKLAEELSLTACMDKYEALLNSLLTKRVRN